MRKTILLSLILPAFLNTAAQDEKSADSSEILTEVIVRAFEQNKNLAGMPAAVITVSGTQLNRYNNTSILPALNSNPGIRMEERSPGSYRLNIRGSSLRSPFGVRNVKIYYNNIPYTDPGGNTYLNQLGFYNIQSLEVIKGPGSSLYGAGTGGVMLLNSTNEKTEPSVSLRFGAGSFNTSNFNLNATTASDHFSNSINYMQLTSDGYRDHTALDRKTFSWDAIAKVNDNGMLMAHFLYGDLYYETPGALTLSQFSTNPKAARPGAESAKAAIYQKFFLGGVNYNQQWGEKWENTTSLYAASQNLRNPSLFNYARTSEPNGGGRTVFRFKSKMNSALLTLHAGAEAQKGYSALKVYGNIGGQPGALQTDIEFENLVYFLFVQASLELPKGWFITTGASINKQKLEISAFADSSVFTQKRNYDNKLAPRLAILKKINEKTSIYVNASNGFSPPTTAEILPSSGIISTDLEAESGTSYEIGGRGKLLRNKLQYDINAFYYRLKNTIVQRRDQNGADFFVNAGSTDQKGIESLISYFVINDVRKPVSDLRVWLSYAWYNFRYKEFTQVNNDYSGKKLPSVPAHSVTLGADIRTKTGFYSNLTYFYNDRIPLNDANTAFSGVMHVLNWRTGYKKNIRRWIVDVYAVADNLLDETYSLGYDINGFGGRYYNAAPGRNFMSGVSIAFLLDK